MSPNIPRNLMKNSNLNSVNTHASKSKKDLNIHKGEDLIEPRMTGAVEKKYNSTVQS